MLGTLDSLAPAAAAAQKVALVAAQGRPLGAAVQEGALAGLAQGLLGMVGRRASQMVGFLQGVGTFHMEEQAAGWKGAAQNLQRG